MTHRAAVAILGAALAGCASKPRPVVRPPAPGEETIRRVELAQVLDATDFVYAIALTPAPLAVAYSHLGLQSFQLGIWEGEPELVRTADVALNPHEHDVEAVAFSPDGTRIAVASRDGMLRLFARDGRALGQFDTGEPLTAVSFSTDGAFLVTGSARGLLSLHRSDDLQLVWEKRAHLAAGKGAEVRAIEVDANGTIFTGGWDKTVARWRIEEVEQPHGEARVRFERKGPHAVFRAMLEGRAPVTLGIDARSPYSFVTTEAAVRAGIDVPFLDERANLLTPSGMSMLRMARNRALTVRTLRIDGVDLAICDTCAEGIDGVLGQDFLARHELLFDQETGEAVLREKTPAEGEPVHLPALVLQSRLTFQQFVNDLTVDLRGERLGIAFGATPAERTLEIYEREKKGIEEPLHPDNFSAIVDAASGAILLRYPGHRGVVATAAISPDGRSLATGGWDKKLHVLTGGKGAPVFSWEFGWSVRRARFSRDGRYLGVASWTPQKPGVNRSDPAATVFAIGY